MEGLRHSMGGRIGMALEGISQYAGIDWRTNIALLGGFAAKEVIISTLGTAYSLGEVDPEASTTLSQRLANDPGWNPVVALAVLAFIMFYAPCFVTVICIAKEAGSWKWGAFSMAFNTLFAFAIRWLYLPLAVIYQIGALLYLRFNDTLHGERSSAGVRCNSVPKAVRREWSPYSAASPRASANSIRSGFILLETTKYCRHLF
jgi:ferrous iron transport protein B